MRFSSLFTGAVALLLAHVAAAQAPVPLSHAIPAAPLANAPGSADSIPVVQGGRLMRIAGGIVQSTDLVTDLRQIIGTPGAEYHTRGLANAGDGFGGSFYWSASSAASDDGYGIIKPNTITGAGRWLRSGQGLPAGSTIGAPAINAAIAEAIAQGYTGLQLPQGNYTLTGVTTGADGSSDAILIDGGAAAIKFTLDLGYSSLNLSAADIGNYANIIQIQNAAKGSDITIAHGSAGYTSPPFAQATLSSVTTCTGGTGGVATFQMLSGFAPTFTHAVRVNDYTPSTKLFIVDALQFAGSTAPLTSIGGGAYTLGVTGSTPCTELAAMTVGHSYTIISQQFGNECANAYHVGNLHFDNFQFTSCPGTGIQVQGAQDISFTNRTGAYYAPGAQQTASGNCVAIIYASGVVTADDTTHMIGCVDDAFFVGVYTLGIASVASLTNVTLTGSPYVLVGDTLQFLDNTGIFKGTAVVATVTPSGGNTVVTLNSPGAPATPTTSWFVYDQSQSPPLCLLDGLYGNVPTRGVFAMCGETIGNPKIQNTYGANIVANYGNTIDGVGPVPTSIAYNVPNTINPNYGNVHPGAVTVMGGNNANATPAPAGQISSVTINGETCINTPSSCLYIGSAANVSYSAVKSTNWNTANAAPTYAQTGSGALNTAAIALINDSGVAGGPDQFLDSTGLPRLLFGPNVTFVPGGLNEPAMGTPTISSGFGSGAAVTASNGLAAFDINVGTGGTATNGVIGLPAAPTGWNCKADDITTQSATVFATRQIGSATTSAALANFNDTGAQAAWAASDHLRVGCTPF